MFTLSKYCHEISFVSVLQIFKAFVFLHFIQIIVRLDVCNYMLFVQYSLLRKKNTGFLFSIII